MGSRCRRATLILAAWLIPCLSSADTTIDRGVAWLIGHQNANGSWGTIPELIARDTSRVLLALQTVHATSPALNGGYAWLASQPIDANQMLAEQALALSAGKLDPSAALAKLAQQHSAIAPDFGGFTNYSGDTYDSALAMQAFSTNEVLYTTTISAILSTLITRQNANGGWGIDQGFDSSPVLTSEVLLGLSALRKESPPPALVAGAQTYLTQLVHADGSIGAGALQTALALRALAISGFVVNSFSTITLTNLRSQQAADGSWNEDPYLTARVIEALATDKPNLTLNSGDFTLTPGTIADGASVTAKITVHNTGTETSGGNTLGIYVSDAPALPIATGAIGSISPGSSTVVTVTFTPQSLFGTHTLEAVADINNQVDEILKTDNQTTATLVVTGKPDLAVFPADVTTNPAHLQPNQSAQLTVTMHNNGEGDVASAGYAVYDTYGSAAEVLLQKGTTGPIPAALAQTVQLPISFAGGSHVVRVVADPDNLISEVTKTNNQAIKTISVSNVTNVDLLVVPGSVAATPSRPAAGTAVTITATIANSGTDPVQSTVGFFDGVPGAGGTLISSSPIAVDAQGAIQVQTVFTTTPTSRVVYVVADPDNLIPEIDKTNNSGYVTLTDQYADLVITRDAIVLPTTLPTAGQTVSARIVVRNTGLLDATNAEVVVYDDLPELGGVTAVDTTVNVPAMASTVVPVSWTLRAGQRFVTAVANPSQAFFEPDYANNRATKLTIASASGGDDVALYASSGPAIDLSAMTIDPMTLSISGIVQLHVQGPNSGTPYLVTVFEDVDGDLAFNPEVDNPLGSVLVQGGSIQSISIPVQGTVRFAPPHLMVYLDSGNAIAEVHEDNNLIDVYHTCQHDNGRSATPGVTYWTSTLPSATLSPVARVLDTNGDGVIDGNDIPEVVIAYNGGIILKRGDTGQTIWSRQLSASGRQISPVIADVDGDGKAESIAHLDVDPVTGATNQHRIVALNSADGSIKWVSPELDRDPLWDFYISRGATYSYAGAPVVADLNGDGHTEVICGRTVLNGADGTIKWVGTGGSGRAWTDDTSTVNLYTEFFPDQEAPIAVDLNNDGILEVVAGNTAYRSDGTILWQRTDLPDGYTSPVWLGTNTNPNICLVALGRVWMLNSDGTTLWGPVSIPNGALLGGAPTVFTNSGTPEVAVAGDGYLSAFNAATGAVLWTRQVATDLTSFGGTTTNSATAFNDDGMTSLFYASRDQFVIIRSDNVLHYTLPISNNPYYPMSPVVADVNNDGHAKVIVPGRDVVRVIGDPTWFDAPAVFNEAAYHAVNVSETGAIPAHEVQDSFSKVNYRANRNLASSTVILDPNLTISYPRADGSAYPASVKLTVRVGNNGWGAAPAAAIAFYRLNADNTSTLLGNAPSDPIASGAYEDVSFTWASPSNGFTFYAVADPANTIHECGTDTRGPNFAVHLSADVAVDPSQFFVDDPNPRQGDVINLSAAAFVTGAVDTTKLFVQFFLGDPASGGTPISPALPVTLTTDRSIVTASVAFAWTVNAPAGTQSIFVFFDPANLIAEDNETNNIASMAINVSTSTPIEKLSGTLTLTPPSAEAGTPVRADLLVQNIGNVPLSNVTLNYTCTSGTSGSATLAALGKNKIASITLGTFTPANNGTYTVTASAANPATLIASPVSIVIGPFAGASLGVVPATVPTTLPIVQVLARISRTNTINAAADPLLDLVRTHVQQGLDFTTSTVTDPSQLQCFKCHVHAQGIVALESGRTFPGVNVSDSVIQTIANLILSERGGDGRVYVQGYYTPTVTREAGWAISNWHDGTQSALYVSPMLDETVADQRADGSWACDGNVPCINSLNDQQGWTLLGVDSLLRGYTLTNNSKYLNSAILGVRWMLSWNSNTVTVNNCEDAARVAITLARAIPYLDSSTATLAQNQIASIASLLRSFQNADGSIGSELTYSPVLRTAQSLYALSLSGAPSSDPAVRAATIWLLNAQQSNGQWPANCCAPARAIDNASWAIVALSGSWSKVNQFSVDLHLTPANSTDLVSSTPVPTVSGGDLVWHLPGITDSGTNTYFNLRLNGLQNQETRPIATAASISYADPNTGQLVTRPLAIPAVTGFSPVALTMTTDQASYGASANVAVQETLDNGSAGLTNDVVVNDASGTAIATLASSQPVAGLPALAFPGWHYAIAATLVPPAGASRNAVLAVDFAQQLALLGVTGTFDPNTIRVSSDAGPSAELPFTWFSTGGSAGNLTLQIGDDVASGTSLPIHIYFDTLENGVKPSSLFDRNVTGIGAGLLANYDNLDSAHSNYQASDPSQLVTIPPPFVTNTIHQSQISTSADLDSVRYWEGTFTGAIYAPMAGTYQFILGSAKGGWLDVDGVRLLNDGGNHEMREVSGSVSLTAGFHRLTVTIYRWDFGTYGMYLKWAPPGSGFALIPSQNLFLDVPFAGTLGAPQTVAGGHAVSSYSWNTASTAAGNYTATATLHQNGAFIVSASAPFSITPSAQLTASVATDKTQYDAGDTVNETATVQYATGNAPLANLTAIPSIADPTGATVSSATSPIASLAPGQNATVTFTWPTGSAPAGTYTASVLVKDSSGATLAQKGVPFQIRATSISGKGISGTLTAPATIPQTETINFAVSLTNAGNSAISSAPFAVQIVDPPTQQLIDTAPFQASAAAGATFTAQVPYVTTKLAQQKYQAWLVSMITGTAVPLSSTTFTVAPPPTIVTATVTTDKPSYDPGATLHSTAAIDYVIGPGPLPNVTVTTTIGTATGTSTIASITPGTTTNTTFDWPVGTTAPGTYDVAVVVKDAAGNQLAQQTTSFTIASTAVTGKGISGTLAAAASVIRGDPLPLTATITDNGNAAITNAPFAVQIVADSVPFTATVAMGATMTSQLTYATGALLPGNYTATLVSLITGQPVTLASSTFTVIPPTIVTATIATDKAGYDAGDTVHVTTTVDYVSGPAPLANVTVTTTIDTASGTSTISSIAPGNSTSVTFDWPAGTNAPGTYTVNVVVTDATGKVQAQQSATFTIISTAVSGKGISGTISTAASVIQGEALPITATISDNGNAAISNAPFAVQIGSDSVPFTATAAMAATVTTQLSYATAALAPGTYTATLVSLITGQPVILATASFDVKPAITLTFGQSSLARALIWSDCSPGNSGKSCTPPTPPFLTGTLTAAGINWVLTGDENSFLTQLRTGAFSESILAPPPTNEPKIADEFSETIHAGSGLLLIKDHPDAMPKLADALGVSFNGKLNATSTLLDILATPFTAAGQMTVNGDGVKINLQTAQPVARISATQAPAISFNLFGAGRVVVLPFDAEQTATTDMAGFLASSAAYISRVPTTDARQVVPLDIAIGAPTGGSQAVTATLTLPPALSIITTTPPPASGTSWNLTIAGGTTQQIIVWLRLPETIGSYDATASVGLQGQLPLLTQTVTLRVDADRAAIETALSNDLTALQASVPASDLHSLTDAQNEFAAARSAADAPSAITDILKIDDDLDAISIDTTAARKDADRLLLYWQSRS